VILPDSVFDTNENLYIRIFIYRFFWVRAIVSLPQVTFQPYTPTKTSLLFAVKKTHDEVGQWDIAWRKAAGEYTKLRKAPIVGFVLQNDRIRNGLITLTAKAEIEWYPSSNLLKVDTLITEIRMQLAEAFDSNSSVGKRLDLLLKELDDFLAKDMLNNLSTTLQKETESELVRLLRHRFPRNVDDISLLQLIEVTYDDIVQASELNYSEDPKGQPYCNAWWVFSEVSSQDPFDYKIFFGEAEHVGYKRTTKHPEGIPQPNDLFQTDSDGTIRIDITNPKTILDHIRSEKVFFCPELTLDEAAAIHVYHRYFHDISQSFKLRFSYRFLHPKFEQLERQYFHKLRTVKLSTLCARPIMRGVQPDYDESEIRVVKSRTCAMGT